MTLAESSSSRRRSAAKSKLGTSQANNILAFVLLAVAAVAPIPLGSNGPVAWSINAVAVAGIALTYGLSLLLTRDSLRVSLWTVFPETVLAGVLAAFLFLQLVPVTVWGGEAFVWDVEGSAYQLAQISIAPGMTILSILCFVTYALYFLLLLQVTANRQRALFLAELIFAVIVAHAVWGLIALTLWGDSLLFFEKWAYFGVATGTFVNRNSFGTFLAIGFVLGLGLTFRAGMRRRSEGGQRLPRHDEKFARVGLQAVGTALILAALLASQSRMGLGAGVAGAMVLLVIAMAKSGIARGKGALLAGAAVLAFVGIVFVIYGGGTLDRLGSVESDADVRQQLYVQVMGMIERHWLTGIGAGTFEVGYPLYHRWPVSPDVIWDKAHNTYLTLWSELGVVFGSVPLLIFGVLSVRLVVLILQRNEDWWLSAISLAAIVVVAIHSLVDFSMEIQGVVFVFLFVLALGLDFRSKSDRPLSASGAVV